MSMDEQKQHTVVDQVTQSDGQRTLFLLKLIPLLVLIALSLLLLYLFYGYENRSMERSLEQLRSTYMDDQKQLIQSETRHAIRLIDYAIAQQRESAIPEAALKQKLLKEIGEIRFGKNGYFYIYDYQGVNLMHPMKPHLVGKNLYALQDGDGVFVIRALIDSAKKGGAYVNYIWDKPDTERPADKVGYAMGVERWQWMVGTGVYVDDIDVVVAKKRQEMLQRLQQSMLYVVVIVLLVLVALSLLLFLLNNRIGRTLLSYQQQIRVHNRSLTEEVEQQTRELQRVSRAKDDFLASMSHELRTPLTSIIGHSELLAEQESEPDRLKMIRSIESAGRGQLALVNDILDMSKIESGHFTIDEHPYDLAKLLNEVDVMLRVRAEDAGLKLNIALQSEERWQLMGDAKRIGQILINLLGNAIKFSEQGEVTLTAWNDGRYLLFKVEDSGIGMSPETIDNLFQRFEQVDGTISRRFGGSGLGLFISLNLAELMGGSIDVSSELGRGSIFQLVLPYRRSEVALHSETRQHAMSPLLDEQLTGAVLVAEDTPELQLLECRILEGMGLSVTAANNGREAVELATECSFDLILMDMQMPEMDGIEATEWLRSAGSTTPIIALTANVMQKHRDAFQQAGCDGFLAKPIDREVLYQQLKQYLAPVTEAPQTPPADAPEEEVDDELMQIFRQSAAKNRELLQAALSVDDWERLRAVAHTIKGGGSSFGFPLLTQRGGALCDALDQAQFERAAALATDLLSELDRVLE